jgi:hypothetical protein
MMTAFDNDEIPPPMPSSWRPYGSGLPTAASMTRAATSRSAGRSFAWKNMPLLVPPR